MWVLVGMLEKNLVTGSNNVFVGYKAGYNETGSNKLYISSYDDDNSAERNLLYGDFSTGDLSLGQTSGTVSILNDADIDGTLETDALSINGTTVTSTAAELNILDGVTATATELNILDGVTSSTAELNILDGVTSTTAELNILDGVTSTTAELNILDGVTSSTAELNILDGVTASATDINLIDGITNGTVSANKAIVSDANKDISGGRNITITGELDAATLDISGNTDIDGTLTLGSISNVESSINSNTSSISTNASNISTNSSAITTINSTTLANFSSGARVFL